MKGLRDVIIRADLETDNAIEHLVAAGQHDDSDVGLGADLARERETVLPRHDDVEQNNVDRTCFQLHPHRHAIRNGADPKSLLLEIARQHLTNADVVVDDQNVDGLFEH